MKKTYILLILIILIILICLISNNENNENYENNKKSQNNKILNNNYYLKKGSKLNKVLTNVLNFYNLKNNNSDWNIYIPHNYNNIEELLINLKANNKYIYGISGCDRIAGKNYIWELLVNKYGRTISSTIMPQSYILNDPNDMSLFANVFNEDDMYILKKNIQRKEGLKLTNNYNDIMNAYNNNYKIIQEYKKNVLLIYNRKVNIRMYLLIVTKNGKVNAYLHEYGKCIYTKKNYNGNNTDFESNITSFNMDGNLYNKYPLTINELKDYLKKNKYDSNFLFQNINNIVNLLMVASDSKLGKLKHLLNNTSFQLFGIDIIVDSSMKPYILELNKGPSMDYHNDKDLKQKLKINADIFQTVGLIKSNSQNKFKKIY